MLFVLAISLATLAYVYAGYPALLRVIVQLRGVRRVRQADITPPLSLVISAYNEASVIRKKLENAVSLTYPREALEIVVVSDASDDGTDDYRRRVCGPRRAARATAGTPGQDGGLEPNSAGAHRRDRGVLGRQRHV